ncbi:hypothetical protein EWB00_005982 [Schistosoma japonicum]|uniref:Uncharacterized protein n=1 Tax=Schistosoma japonicum TaxID=6182 RepID=A0A4Z2DTA2_SCHJA|nr:hypothetical protein EWB00_005982 [Schistosoma japonicum]
MCITGDHDTPFISLFQLLLDQKKPNLFDSTNNLSSSNDRQQKPIHNSALFPSICSSPAKFTTTERSGILIILFLLLGDMLCSTPRFTHSFEESRTATEDNNSKFIFVNSSASFSALKPTRLTRRTSKLSRLDIPKTDIRMYLNKARRYSLSDDQTEIKLLSPELVEFICHRLPDPCARAAYLRQHVRHDLCFRLPLLYLLPHIDSRLEKPYLSEYKPGTCKGGLSHLAYLPSDSIFEQFLTPVHTCEHSLLSLKKIMDDNLTSHFGIFDDLLNKSFCIKPFDSRPNVTGECQCQECQEAYRNWFCATEFPLYYPIDDSYLNIPPHLKLLDSNATDFKVHPVTISNTSANFKMYFPQMSNYFLNKSSLSSFDQSVADSTSQKWSIYRSTNLKDFQSSPHLLFRLAIVQPCISWCTQVETVCPYLNPADPTSNGGEPAFLCDESHYHHSSRYQAVYWDMNTCESECCFGVSDSILLSIFIPDKKQYSTATDILSSYSYSFDNSNDNYSCSHLRDRCLHRFLSMHSSLLSEFPVDVDYMLSLNFSDDVNLSSSINTMNFSDGYSSSTRSLSPIQKIDKISLQFIVIMSCIHLFT